MIDPTALQAAFRDPDTRIGLQAVADRALEGGVARADPPQYLTRTAKATLGVWGEERQSPESVDG